MANINERIKNISNYFVGMKVDSITMDDGSNSQVIYVIVNFPRKWEIDKDIPNKFNISVAQSDEGEYFFCANLEQGFDVVFDAIEYNVNKMETIEERNNLLKRKINELSQLFMNEEIPIESLRTLEFKYKAKKDKKMLIPKQDNNEEKEEENE